MTRREAFSQSLLRALGITAAVPAKDQRSKLERLLDHYGEDAVGRELAQMVDLKELDRRLGRIRNREHRHADARRRRENNRDIVLYRGPADWGDLAPERWLEVKTKCRHRVAVLRLERDIELAGRTVTAGAKVVIDMRHGLPAMPMCEIVQTYNESTRLHIWGRKELRQSDIAVPAFTFREPASEEELFSIQERLEVG
jgi:hypothetical protein